MSQTRDFFANFRLLNSIQHDVSTRFPEFVQDGQSYTISPSTVVVIVASRHVLPRDHSCSTNRNVSRLQDQFKYPCALASRVTLVKITKPDSHTSHAGEKSSLVGYKRTPCSTPLLPLSHPSSASFPALQAGSGTTLQNR